MGGVEIAATAGALLKRELTLAGTAEGGVIATGLEDTSEAARGLRASR